MNARHRSAGAVAALAILAQALGPIPTALAADPIQVTFTATGSEQHFDVPAGVTSLHVTLFGGWGGGNGGAFEEGGRGARVDGDLAVAPGQHLYVEVGSSGPNGDQATTVPGFNGGGAAGFSGSSGRWVGQGGGASDVRTITRDDPGSLASRLIVAGGGGGDSGPGTGGDAGNAGGGGATGGGAGTASTGGSGGIANDQNGQPGSAGVGGRGGSVLNGSAGGGGGGGYYGGGGGGGGSAGGGGGGGSSYIGAATNAAVAASATNFTAIYITYTPATGGGGGDAVTVNFAATGAEQSWVVPDGVTSVSVVLVGGSGSGASLVGGRGHRVAGNLQVVPGMTLYVEVGGNGVAKQGGFNGGGNGGSGTSSHDGGGGGGATDLRTVSGSAGGSLDSRLVVAAGGGGRSPANSGGDAGQPGGGARSGGAGTSSAGGALGTGSEFGFDGFAGTVGIGGLGGHVVLQSTGDGGGGGGGGYYGGGGGGASTAANSGAGGGGSSYTGSATNTAVTLDSSATPSLSITYTASSGGSTAGTVNAVVTMATSAVCLELSTTSVDFGTRRFGETGAAAAPFIDITNCGGIDENILVRGTDATGPGSSAWSLVSFGACETGVLGTDKYRMRLAYVASPDVYVAVTTENTQLDSLGPDDTVQHEAQIDTPCPGSSGAGETMSMQILFTAIEEAAP